MPTITQDTTTLGLSLNQGRGKPEEHDFNPHLFQPTHPNDNDEGDVTDINESYQLETQDFFDHGIRQPNEGDEYMSYRVFVEGANFGQCS